MACECCDQLAAKLASIEAKLAALKPIDENALIQKAITGSTNAILPKIPSDDRISQLGVAGVAATGLYAAKEDLLNLRLNFATKTEVKAVKTIADRADVNADNLKSKQDSLEANLRSKADETRLAELETKNEANAAREALAKDVQAQVNEAKARASKALSTSEQATKLAQEAESALAPVKAEVSTLSGKIGKLLTEVGAEVEKIVAPLRSGLGKLQGAVDGILGKITTILNELGVLSPLKRLIGLVGKLLWVIDVITAFISFDTFATVKGLQVRVDGLESNMDRINQDISDMLGRYGGLRAEVRRAEANAQKAINEAEKSASDAASATDQASNALAKAIRAISESDAASGLANSATSEAKNAVNEAVTSLREAKNASSLALTAKNEIAATGSRLAVTEVKIAGINSEIGGIHGDIQGVRNEVFGAESVANQALSIGIGLVASYGVLKGGQALLGSRVSRVESELQTVKNRPGIPGKDGRNGLDGKPGKDGKNGLNGKPGLRGLPGIPGLRGLPGINGRNGVDGKNGLDGKPGLRGLPGLNGKNGLDGKPGLPGKDGLNGRDGKDVNPADLAAINAKLDRNFGEIKATHIEATGANQKATFIQRSVAGLNTFVVTNFATTIQLIKNFSGSFERFAKWAHLDRVLGVINLATNLHNALMLSTNLGQSLMSLISNSLNALGLGLKDKDGHSLDLGALINGSIEALVIKVVGRDNYTQASSFVKATSAIYQAAMNGVYAISAMVDATRNIAEIGASYTGKIGNALKRSGAIFEHSFGWMNENLNATTATSTRWENFFSKIDDTANAVQSLDMVAGSVVSIKDSVTQLKQTREEFNTAHKAAEDSLAGKAAESKLESQAPVTLLDAHIGKAE
jgi:methyl-accepting chemotaxis protein